MAADELTKALLLEEVCAPQAIAEALFASVNGGVPLLQALVDSGAASGDVLSRYLGRSEAPFLRQVIPIVELVERLPPGLCKRLLALPVRHDAITGTVDVAVADPADPHPASEIAFHLGVPVRVLRATVAAIEEALRRLRISAQGHVPPAVARFHEAARTATRDAAAEARPVPPRRGGLVIEADSVPPPPAPAPTRIRTPPWGTPIHMIGRPSARPRTEPPRSDYGSEIPIPLTRKTVLPRMFGGGTEQPPPRGRPATAGLGEGYAFDTTGFRDVVEKTATPLDHENHSASIERPDATSGRPIGSFIPGPPRLPGSRSQAQADGQRPASVHATALPFADMGGVMVALRGAGSRDEVLELVLAGARMVAAKVALFVVKKGGYLGWVGSPEFGDRTALQSVLIPLEANSIFDRAVREDLYLGPIRYDDVHAPLLRVMRNASRDVAAVPIRVSGKTAVIIVADDLEDTMIGTRRLEELARASGEAFARIVRTRR